VYSVEPGETLRHLIQRAGGLTSQAYLYGSQFTREATRREQQLRLDAYTNSVARQVEQSAGNLASASVNAQAAATASQSIASQREMVNRLRAMRATGRIVMHIDPARATLNSIPDMALEDGDRFNVPAVPATVGVVGAVYNQNAFLYDGRRAESYLGKAGGPTRTADHRREFIIHADGSVVSRANAMGSLWSSDSFERQRIYPGDTIMVPEKLNMTTALRGIMDWTTVMSQLAFGAAAINVLH